jgi:hypothetical protein
VVKIVVDGTVPESKLGGTSTVTALEGRLSPTSILLARTADFKKLFMAETPAADRLLLNRLLSAASDNHSSNRSS